MKKLNKIKLIAIDSDGVLLNDTYSPAIKSFVEKHDTPYTALIERLVWGSPQITAGHNLALACKLPWSGEKTIADFFKERDNYLKDHPVHVLPGIENTLSMLASTGAKLVSYGGRNREYSFDTFLGDYRHYFDKDVPYVDINGFRPGVNEIVKDIFHYNYDEVVFIDDINRVAEVCKALNTGFIGIPANMAHNFQKDEMSETGVKLSFAKFNDITENSVYELDKQMSLSKHWG
ncbi:phosphoglycolate phosphatase-like HAD superfamily hydrolase [Serratia fonticola]|uniref:Phosphoglycolate phosphatase-like HAD superfamily hydrolase n=1 Tax=Serratia fonticola TaxID=47917 RepID=A0A559TAD3_SERFO|nr:HAD family hydrolase [Serratia fonticola]TQI80893.1 phosphoglycolate phosphatase-like HAD superfamily hydrolase [Serratia fonticola]TQI97082.1 phosphoglycolate phosphatase-like HAD superfamily hydrolase [Serratia fonticola]TVZ71578.1 phosphoglycolate phosphatase-like HAD superfamily hydrolase [Serratia fonticola]